MNIFLAADLHIGHQGITKFLRSDNITKERPWDNIEDMDNALIENWNKTVGVNDKVYVLGDVVINRKHMHKIGQLNGVKILIAGNHDVMRTTEYLEYFKEVRGVGVLSDFVLSHIPIHPCSLERWSGNWHGHLHSKEITLPDGSVDTRYMCLSMEHINFTPISLEDAKKKYILRKEAYNETISPCK